MKKIISEFREFAIRGNMLDLAIGVIIGAAFNKIVSSIVNDLIAPLLGLIAGKIDFANRFLVVTGGEYETAVAASAAGEVVITYGTFLQNVIDFLLVAIVIFILVKQINRFRKKADPTTKTCSFCTRNIPLAATRCPECTSQLA